VVQLIFPAGSALLSHLPQSPANSFGGMGPWPASSS
jgi:hypothetical protein